jgi:RimJ/RimL family protein N-acetyltransferase
MCEADPTLRERIATPRDNVASRRALLRAGFELETEDERHASYALSRDEVGLEELQ